MIDDNTYSETLKETLVKYLKTKENGLKKDEIEIRGRNFEQLYMPTINDFESAMRAYYKCMKGVRISYDNGCSIDFSNIEHCFGLPGVNKQVYLDLIKTYKKKLLENPSTFVSDVNTKNRDLIKKLIVATERLKLINIKPKEMSTFYGYLRSIYDNLKKVVTDNKDNVAIYNDALYLLGIISNIIEKTKRTVTQQIITLDPNIQKDYIMDDFCSIIMNSVKNNYVLFNNIVCRSQKEEVKSFDDMRHIIRNKIAGYDMNYIHEKLNDNNFLREVRNKVLKNTINLLVDSFYDNDDIISSEKFASIYKMFKLDERDRKKLEEKNSNIDDLIDRYGEINSMLEQGNDKLNNQYLLKLYDDVFKDYLYFRDSDNEALSIVEESLSKLLKFDLIKNSLLSNKDKIINDSTKKIIIDEKLIDRYLQENYSNSFEVFDEDIMNLNLELKEKIFENDCYNMSEEELLKKYDAIELFNFLSKKDVCRTKLKSDFYLGNPTFNWVKIKTKCNAMVGIRGINLFKPIVRRVGVKQAVRNRYGRLELKNQGIRNDILCFSICKGPGIEDFIYLKKISTDKVNRTYILKPISIISNVSKDLMQDYDHVFGLSSESDLLPVYVKNENDVLASLYTDVGEYFDPGKLRNCSGVVLYGDGHLISKESYHSELEKEERDLIEKYDIPTDRNELNRMFENECLELLKGVVK